MIIFRPVTLADLDAVFALAERAPAGLTTLPADRAKLKAKILESVKNQDYPPSRPGGESFLFVLEEAGEIIGTSAVFSKVGGFHPFWTYAIKSCLNECPELGVSRQIDYLELKCLHDGPSEIGTLFLDPRRRQHNAGRFLSLARFLFIAAFPQMFEDEILAELRGSISPDGRVIFWDAVTSHFFGIPFEQADRRVTSDKSFIAQLMPKFPLYISLLPKEVQHILGAVAEETRPALRLLEQEGFERLPEIDIFEAGPVLSCKTAAIRTVRQSRRALFHQALSPAGWEALNNNGRLFMIARTRSIKDFCAAVTELHLDERGLILPATTAAALDLQPGEELLFSPLRSESKL